MASAETPEGGAAPSPETRATEAHAEVFAAISAAESGADTFSATATVTRLHYLDPDTEAKHINNADKKSDTRLKRLYAVWFIGILIGQLVLMNLVFIGVGVGCLSFHEYALHLYMGGTLAEVFGIVFVITKYLFPKRAD